MEEFKDVTIEGRKFRIGLIPAMRASWIIAQVQSGRSTDESVFSTIQGYFFEACSYYKVVSGQPDLPVALFERPNRWLLKGMERDLTTVQELFEEAMEFNLGPFGERCAEKRRKQKEAADALAEASDTPLLTSPLT